MAEDLTMIKKHGGLYSWEHCLTNKIHIPRPGGNQLSRALDTERGLSNYVRLSFVRDTPMLHVAQSDGRIRRPQLLEIDVRVAFEQNTLFSDGNATARKTMVGSELEDFQRIRFDILRKTTWTNEDEKFYWQAEVLVKRHIPLQYIRNL